MRKFLVLGNDHILDQVVRALRVNGYEAECPTLEEEYQCSPEQLRDMLDKFPADAIITRNRRIFDRSFNPHGIELHQAVAQARLPYLSWFLEAAFYSGSSDARQYFYEDPYPLACNCCFAKDVVTEMEEYGHMAYYLPNACTPEDHQPVEVAKEWDVSFIGQPKVHSREIEYDSPEDLYKKIIKAGWQKAAKVFMDNHFGPTTRESFDVVIHTGDYRLEVFEALRKDYLHNATNIFSHSLQGQVFVQYARYIMICILQVVKDLPVDLRLFGGEGWARHFSDMQDTPRVERSDLALFYNKSKINLALTKLELGDSVHERVFNMAAARSFQIAEYRPSIRELFSADQVPCFKSLEELKEQIPYYLERPKLRDEMAQAAYECATTQHTYAQRVELMVMYLKSHVRGVEDQQ